MRAKVIVRRFDGRVAFVPEGQADSSQARSAWVTMQRGPRPEGTVEVIVSPTDICRRKLSPGMSKRQRVECSSRFRNARYSCGKVRVDNVRPDF
jgi:hypothetical protein